MYGIRYLKVFDYVSVSECATAPARESEVCPKRPQNRLNSAKWVSGMVQEKQKSAYFSELERARECRSRCCCFLLLLSTFLITRLGRSPSGDASVDGQFCREGGAASETGVIESLHGPPIGLFFSDFHHFFFQILFSHCFFGVPSDATVRRRMTAQTTQKK